MFDCALIDVRKKEMRDPMRISDNARGFKYYRVSFAHIVNEVEENNR